MTEQEARLYALRKLRELGRDLLFAKYGDNWRQYDRFAGQFFASPSEEELTMLDAIREFAEIKRQ